MSDETLRKSIKAIFETIPAAGKIHDYYRWSVDASKFLDMFKNTDGKIYGWELSGNSIKAVESVNNEQFTVTRVYKADGWYALKDDAATEKAFAALVGAIALKVASTDIDDASDYATVTVPVMDHRMLGNTLCHHAEMHIEVSEIVELEVVDEEITSIMLQYYLKPGDDVLDAEDLIEEPAD